jgi:sec-independent protein translocase protein TatB
MFNIGFGEMLVIALVFIIVVGPDRLPELLRTLGKSLRTVQKANQDLRSSIGIDKLRQELFYPTDFADPLKWRPKPTLHNLPPQAPKNEASELPRAPELEGAASAPAQTTPAVDGDPSNAPSSSLLTDEEKKGEGGVSS